MYYSDDPARDYLEYDRKRTRRVMLRPRCDECDEYIQDDELYDFDGKLICSECLIENHLKSTNAYIDEII